MSEIKNRNRKLDAKASSPNEPVDPAGYAAQTAQNNSFSAKRWLLHTIIGAILLLPFLFGIHKSVTFQPTEMQQLYLIYKTHVGPYWHMHSPTIELVANTLGKEPSRRSFGLYFDKPSDVAKENLRCIGGYILDSTEAFNDFNRTITEQYPNSNISLAILPKTKYISTDWHWINSVSVMMGAYKVYGALGNYVKENNITLTTEGGAIEIYNTAANKIVYLIPTEHGDVLSAKRFFK